MTEQEFVTWAYTERELGYNEGYNDGYEVGYDDGSANSSS